MDAQILHSIILIYDDLLLHPLLKTSRIRQQHNQVNNDLIRVQIRITWVLSNVNLVKTRTCLRQERHRLPSSRLEQSTCYEITQLPRPQHRSLTPTPKVPPSARQQASTTARASPYQNPWSPARPPPQTTRETLSTPLQTRTEESAPLVVADLAVQ